MMTDVPLHMDGTSRTARGGGAPFVTPGRELAGLRVLVLGLGRFGGGVGVTRFLADKGARVTVSDRADGEQLADSVRAVSDLDVDLHLGGHDPRDLDDADLVIVNPAVHKARNEFFQEVIARGVDWTTEINLFCSRCPAPIIGVTGSFGKSTVCTMLAEALQACADAKGSGRRVYLGGNIGGSLLLELDRIRSTDEVVLELSNAQLDDLPRIGWAPPVALITNIHPHHLERYESYDAYVDAKLNIARDPMSQSRIIVGGLDPVAEAALSRIVKASPGRVIEASPLAAPLALRVPGRHNQSNAALVLEATATLGLDQQVALQALEAFSGLPHRLEPVRELDGVRYVNDSKATSPASVVSALSCFDAPIVAIVGGQDKGERLDECAAALLNSCRGVVCTGESGHRVAVAIRHLERHIEEAPSGGRILVKVAAPAASGRGQAQGTPVSGAFVVREAPDVASALKIARTLAVSGDVVLYSPGAPSFDAYVNFDRRGHHFMELVGAL